jgi:polyisoprenoid-binding protein YceI
MNPRLLPLAGVLALSAAPAAPAPLTASGGTATFEYRVLIVNVTGTMDGVTSTVNLDVDDLAATTGTVTVPLSGLRTGIGLRDAHTRSALNTQQFPSATFTLETLTGGRLTEGQTLATTATGQLTVRGVTRPLSAPVKATLNAGRVRVSTQFQFNPLEYGVRYPGGADFIAVKASFVLAAR